MTNGSAEKVRDIAFKTGNLGLGSSKKLLMSGSGSCNIYVTDLWQVAAYLLIALLVSSRHQHYRTAGSDHHECSTDRPEVGLDVLFFAIQKVRTKTGTSNN
jgi:hypothetical protein